MNIEPRFLAHLLHDAAIKQARSELERDGYEIDARSATPGTGYRPDIVARRGGELIAVEAKVLGERSGAKVADASRWAREHGARLRLLLIRPQREVGIEVAGIDGLVLEALRAAGNDLPAPLGGTRIEGVAEVGADAIALTGPEARVSGSAFALVGPPEKRRDDAVEDRAVPFTYTIWFDPVDRRLTRSARITWDLSELDEDA